MYKDQHTVTTATVTTRCFKACSKKYWQVLYSLDSMWLQLQRLQSAGPMTDASGEASFDNENNDNDNNATDNNHSTTTTTTNDDDNDNDTNDNVRRGWLRLGDHPPGARRGRDGGDRATVYMRIWLSFQQM